MESYLRIGMEKMQENDTREFEDIVFEDGTAEVSQSGKLEALPSELSGQTIPKTARKRSWTAVFIAITVVIALILASGAYLYIVFPSRLPWGTDGVFTLMVMGTDVDYVGHATEAKVSVGRADAVMLLVMPRRAQAAMIISIPRDTLVPNGGKHEVRFNSLYKGIPPIEMAAGIKKLTGLDVDRWIKVDFDAFEGVVDALGGIEINVEKRMHYTDVAGGYSLNLQPGVQMMDGETALAYVRFRNDALGDISRVSRQQEFVMTLAKAALKPSSIFKAGEFKSIIDRYVSNDMNLYEYAAIGVRTLKIGVGAMKTLTLPGTFEGPYWRADVEKTKQMLLDFGNGGPN
jgi:LCP family protein required for cell wall assembly